MHKSTMYIVFEIVALYYIGTTWLVAVPPPHHHTFNLNMVGTDSFDTLIALLSSSHLYIPDGFESTCIGRYVEYPFGNISSPKISLS